METSLTCNDKVVRQFTIAIIVWGIIGSQEAFAQLLRTGIALGGRTLGTMSPE